MIYEGTAAFAQLSDSGETGFIPPYVNQAQWWQPSSGGLHFVSKASVQGNEKRTRESVVKRMDRRHASTSERRVLARFYCSAVWCLQMLVGVNEKDVVWHWHRKHRTKGMWGHCWDLWSVMEMQASLHANHNNPKRNREGSHVSANWNIEQQRQVFKRQTNTLTILLQGA